MKLTSQLSPISLSRIRPSAKDLCHDLRLTPQTKTASTTGFNQRTDKCNLPSAIYFTPHQSTLTPGSSHQNLIFYRTLNAASKTALLRRSLKCNRKVEGKPYPLLKQGFHVRVSPRRGRRISALCPRRCPRHCPRPCPCPWPQSVRDTSTSSPQSVRADVRVSPRWCPHCVQALSVPCPRGVRRPSVRMSASCPPDHE
jgi:hypothetical protein